MKVANRPLTPQEQQMARESLPLVKQLADIKAEGQVHIGDLLTGPVAVPKVAFDLLAVILEEMAQGRLVEVRSTDTELSTQEAATRLNMSRPHLVKLLENGDIPFRKVGSHRRVLLEDLLRYEAQRQVIRQEKLQFLADQAQELGMGYE